MGIVKRQGIKTSAIKYFAIPLGFLASIFVYPYNAKTNDAYGLYNYLFSLANLLIPFFFFGVHNIAIKYFPIFRKDSETDRGFLSFLLRFSFVTILIGSGIFILFYDSFFDLVANSNALSEYSIYSICIAILFGLCVLFTQYISNFGRVVVPNLVEILRNRIFFPLLVFIVGLGIITEIEFVWGVLLLFLVCIVFLLFYLNHLGHFKLNKVDSSFVKTIRKPIIVFGLFSAATSIGDLLCSQIDSVMISDLINTRNNGIYFVGKNISNVLAVPAQSIFVIASPIIVKYIENNDKKGLQALYTDSSNVLFTLSIFFFLLLMVGDDFLLSVINRGEVDYSQLKLMFKILGFSIVFNSLTSLNSHIIAYSKYYKFNLISVFFVGISNIVMNYIFIVVYQMGIQGVALASTITLFMNDLLRLIFVYWKFKIHPFTNKIVYLLFLGIGIFIAVEFFLPQKSSFLYVIILALVVSIVYLVPVLYFKISPQINSTIISLWERVKKVLKVDN